MTLDKLTTPFERRRIIEYAPGGNTPVRHWYEVQQVDGIIYKTKDEPDEYGDVQFKLCIFFDNVHDGVRLMNTWSPHLCTVEAVKRYAEANGFISLDSKLKKLEEICKMKGFIGGAEIEFIRQYDPALAERCAISRQMYYARQERAEQEERRLVREAVEEELEVKRKAELEAEKAKYYGWADNMTPLKFGKVKTKMEKMTRFNGKIMQTREFVVSLIKDGYIPEKEEGVASWYGSKWNPKQSKPRTEYFLFKDRSGYKIGKTEYDFAVYLTEHKELLAEG